MNSAPVTAVKPDPPPRQGLVKFIYRVSRAGNGRPAELPSSPSIGVLAFVCWQYSLMKKFVPKRSKPNSNFNNFTQFLGVSAFDEAGISYRLRDNVCSEE